MKLNVCWMYHDIMDLYGDRGNIMVLKKRCLDRGIEFDVQTCGIGEEIDLAAFDLVFFGGGADKEQNLIIEDLKSRKANIQEALNQQTFFFLVCGGYQLFGKYYVDANSNKIEGLGFFEYETAAGLNKERCIGNIVIECEMENERFLVVGFENHGGQTKNVEMPFGRVLAGYGNDISSKKEGFYNGQVLGTYLHGPLLPKNPKLADKIITKSLSKRYGSIVLEDLEDSLEKEAHRSILKKLNISFES